jgi:hypothetical protein
MWTTTRVYPRACDLSYAAKESDPDAAPPYASMKVRLAAKVRYVTFFLRGLIETVLLPHFADSDARKGSTGCVHGRDRPVWSDCLRERNEAACQHGC